MAEPKEAVDGRDEPTAVRLSKSGCEIFVEYSYRYPVARLDPATHVLLGRHDPRIEDVDARVKPGQGELRGAQTLRGGPEPGSEGGTGQRWDEPGHGDDVKVAFAPASKLSGGRGGGRS